MTDWYKIKRVLTWVNWEEKQIYPAARLPSAYQEVEYIQWTGTQAIDCNIVIWATKLKTDLKINSQYIWESAIFLSRWTLNWNFLMFYNNAFRWHSASSVDISCALNTDYSIQTENWKITINWTSYTCTASSSDSSSDLSMCIFGKSWATTYWRFKLYYMKMWDNTTLVRDLVPCYRKSDSVIWMYDLVNNQFYMNSWTWTFAKWPDVN